jgi:hypothetical protein
VTESSAPRPEIAPYDRLPDWMKTCPGNCGAHIAFCCDTDDCGPCCPECSTCPTLLRQRVERAREVAVALEQEHARLTVLAQDVVADQTGSDLGGFICDHPTDCGCSVGQLFRLVGTGRSE